MASKSHPIGMRVGIMKSRPAERFAKYKRTGADFFVEDIKMRKFVDDFFSRSGISKVVIRKTAKEGEIIIFSSKVGVLMGKQGAKIKEFEDALKKKFKKDMKVIIKEVKVPELSAKIMAEFIASQLEARMPFRKVAK
jgi:small subunit ribosomal protein S3